MPNRLNIGFVPLYDINYASSRYRVFQFISRLQRHNFRCRYLPAPLFNHFKRLIYLPRLFILARSCDVLYIQKRIFPSWVVNQITRVNDHIIFDYDDALYLQPARIKQFHHILSKASLVVAGNECLAGYARRFNPSVVIIPTVVATDHYAAVQDDRHPAEPRVLIGWIGSDPNRGDLDLILESLERLAKPFYNQAAILVIARHPFYRPLNIPQIFTSWTLDTYLQSLQKIDIGIMPLQNNAWNQAKCAFKLIQYSSIQAATIASPVGMNTDVVLHNKTGFLAASQNDWYKYLSLLIQDSELRAAFGYNGRIHVEQNYSVDVWLPKLIEVIEQAAK